VGDIAIDNDITVWGLKNWPLDLVSWGYTNSHRSDVCLDPTASLAAGDTQSTNKVLPQNERSPSRWYIYHASLFFLFFSFFRFMAYICEKQVSPFYMLMMMMMMIIIIRKYGDSVRICSRM
jgi:hypothetical protein